MPDKKEKLQCCLDLICDNNMLVLATQGEHGPYTSLMAYACKPNGQEIYMISSRQGRKWKNISQHPQVSLLIDDRTKHTDSSRNKIKALTVTGIYVPVKDDEERESIMKHIAGTVPAIASAFSGPECGIIRIKVESLLLLDGPTDSYHLRING